MRVLVVTPPDPVVSLAQAKAHLRVDSDDEDALIAALESGQLFAAGLDVFRREPDFDERLARLPNVFLTPHMGSATVATRNQMGFDALDNIAAVLAGRPPLNPV